MIESCIRRKLPLKTLIMLMMHFYTPQEYRSIEYVRQARAQDLQNRQKQQKLKQQQDEQQKQPPRRRPKSLLSSVASKKRAAAKM